MFTIVSAFKKWIHTYVLNPIVTLIVYIVTDRPVTDIMKRGTAVIGEPVLPIIPKMHPLWGFSPA
jgi:hypothetical protein